MRYGIAVLGMLLSTAPMLAWAQDGWVITEQGKKPDREITVVRDETIIDHSDVQGFLETASRKDRKAYEAWMRDGQYDPQTRPAAGPAPRYEFRTETIYESPAKPGSLLAVYNIDCASQTLNITYAMTFWRQKAADKLADVPDHAPANTLEQRLAEFACNGGGATPGDARTRTLTARGYTRLPDVGTNAQDFVWAKIWQAKEPAYSREVMEGNLNRSVGALTKTMERSQQTMADTARRMGQFQQDAARSKNRIGRSTALETWIHRNESDFVRRYGAPDQVYDAADGIRTLSYRLRETTTSTSPQPIGMTATGAPIMQDQTTSQTQGCDFNVQLRDGTIFDYSVTAGDACPRMLNDF